MINTVIIRDVSYARNNLPLHDNSLSYYDI